MKRIRRAFISTGADLLTTGDLVAWCYPRVGKPGNNHRTKVRLAATAVGCVRVGRAHARGRGIIWRARSHD